MNNQILAAVIALVLTGAFLVSDKVRYLFLGLIVFGGFFYVMYLSVYGLLTLLK